MSHSIDVGKWRVRLPVSRFVIVRGGGAGFYWWQSGMRPDWLIPGDAVVLGGTIFLVAYRYVAYRSHGCWSDREFTLRSLLIISLMVLFVTNLKFNAYVLQLMITLALMLVSFVAHKLFPFKG